MIDSEGLGSTEESKSHDNKILLISLLLSSLIIYNSQGSIDENALMNIQYIVNLAREIV